MRIISWLILGIFLASTSPAQAKKKSKSTRASASLPALLEKVEKKYATAKTLSANFIQVIETAALKQKKESTGKLLVRRPDRVRWETLTPEASLFISNGKKVWYYTPPFDEGDHGQLIERKASKVQSDLMNALISGSFSLAKDMKFTETKTEKGTEKTGSIFELTPLKKGAAGTVIRAEITIQPEKLLIEKVLLNHAGGNRAEIRLEQIELGRELNEGEFEFIAPKNTAKTLDP